jgi:hypothetical protein
MSSRRHGPIRHLSLSNVVSLVALFVALGGSAYALSNNSVKSRHIANGQVKTEDLDDSAVTGAKINAGAVKGGDVGDDELTGEDVEGDSLSGQDIDEASLEARELPPMGSLVGQGQDLGSGGETRFIAPSGVSTASASADQALVGGPAVGLIARDLFVWIADTLGSGQSRTFTLMRAGQPGASLFDTGISCTISEGQQFCSDPDNSLQLGQQLITIRVQSNGGVDGSDDAFTGLVASALP